MRSASPGAVLSVSAAARALGLRQADAVAWLRASGLVRRILVPRDDGVVEVERVLWDDVLARIRGETLPTPVSATNNLKWRDPR